MPDEAPEQPTTITGGVNQVQRIGDTIVRPAGPHTPAIHAVLNHLRSNGFQTAPQVLDFDEDAGTETLSWVTGDVTEFPFDRYPTDQVLVTAARLLRQLHDASVGFDFDAQSDWHITPETPAEVVCHGDFAPYNCTIVDGEVVGVFDFDTAHPGPRLSDLGYAAYRWVPLDPPGGDEPGALAEQRRKLQLFCDSYGTSAPTESILDHAIEGLERMIRHMAEQAESGHEMFQQHINDGHDLVYRNAIQHIRENRHDLA